ncbi:DUF937 domain-containing protein [Taibaiella soli]|uniref:DUF937 domain-containing protein n=1 Tax=Taibaiella soli TaxID=1649169 RepID=A0A2W2B2L8_9BACT|nr:DUF937 domain-containing protein [Taibaiella soli]PZF74524.1 hypothetical protein DN068_02815 [Taibaiella soli]
MTTLFEQVKNAFGDDFVMKAAGALEESDASIQQALPGALSAAFTRLVQKTDNVAGGMDVYNMAKEAADSGAATNPATLLTGGDLPGISELDTGLFGDKLAGIAKALSSFANIQQSSAVSLLTIAGITTLSILGLHIREYGLSAADLGHMIQTQKEDLLATVPAGFNLVGGLGIRDTTAMSAETQDTAPSPVVYNNSVRHHTARKSTGWVVPMVFLLIIITFIWYFTKSCNQRSTQQTVPVPKSQEP